MSEDKEILYSASGRTGTYYEEEELTADEIFFEWQIALYQKVGAFYGWSWKEFVETPIPVINRLSEEIDFRMENLDTDVFLSWPALFVLLGIAKAFGGKKES